jgi:hypothetical protein
MAAVAAEEDVEPLSATAVVVQAQQSFDVDIAAVVVSVVEAIVSLS